MKSHATPPRTGAYYRVREAIDSLAVGSLVLAWTNEDGQIEAQQGEQGFNYDPNDFVRCFEPAPTGRAERMAELQKILEAADVEETEVAPEPLLLGTLGESVNNGQALVTLEHRNHVVEAKRSAIRAKQKAEVIKIQMKGLLKEQEQAITLAASKHQAEADRLNYVVDSINLYLGRDEDFEVVQEGDPADPSEPITIRQTVLMMDEECALHVDDGGIDFKSISDFDRWLAQPGHLAQILPEPRGIAALRPRRSDKWYDNASIWEQMMMRDANMASYILVRNGQKLWRIWTPLKLPDHLFATRAEFEELFHDSWNPGEMLRPGTVQYQRALAAEKGLRRLYLQAALLLQGIIDRTGVFDSAKAGKVNLLDPDQDPSVIRLIRDAENLLATGRPDFRSWQKELNSRIEVGKRIVFGGTEYSRHQHESHKYKSTRTHPGFISWPDRNHVYTLRDVSEKDGCNFMFQFVRDSGRKATFHVSRTDDFILNFDDADEKDIQFYLADRCNRHNYLTMVPLLEAALRLRQTEQQAEAPFIDLLARKASEQQNASEQEIRELLPAVIRWWKQKNRFSRNLLLNERAAYSQILQEVKLRREIYRNPADTAVAEKIKAARPGNWLLIAKDTGNTVVCLCRLPGLVGLVDRETRNATGAAVIATDHEHMPGTETGRWQVLAEQPDWATWPKHGRKEEYLTETEYQQLLQEVKDWIADEIKDDDWINLVAITASADAIYAYGAGRRYTWSTQKNPPEWSCACREWYREQGQLRLKRPHTPTSELCLDPADENPNQVDGENAPFYEKARISNLGAEVQRLPFLAHGHRLLFLDEAALAEARKLIKKEHHKRKRHERQWDLCRAYEKHVEKVLEERFWSGARERYLADGGPEELWEDAKKTIKYRPLVNLRETDLESCLTLLIEKSTKLAGRQTGEIWGLAAELGWKAQNPAANQRIPPNIPLEHE